MIFLHYLKRSVQSTGTGTAILNIPIHEPVIVYGLTQVVGWLQAFSCSQEALSLRTFKHNKTKRSKIKVRECAIIVVSLLHMCRNITPVRKATIL